MNEEVSRRLQDRLVSGQPEEAWAEFLDAYVGRILGVVRRVVWDPDRRIDCFVFVCEELHRDRCRRLRRFDPARGASFAAWVQVVAHNLCLDWRRKQAGRFRPFRSLADLSAQEEEIYRCIFARGLSVAETRQTLLPDHPGLTESRVAETVERIRRRLTPRQHWLLSVQRPKVVPLAERADVEKGAAERQVAAPGPDPVEYAAHEERRARLAAALGRLPAEDRLLVRLRFEEGLTLHRVASLAGLRNAQQADRRLQEVLARLRDEMDAMERGGG